MARFFFTAASSLHGHYRIFLLRHTTSIKVVIETYYNYSCVVFLLLRQPPVIHELRLHQFSTIFNILNSNTFWVKYLVFWHFLVRLEDASRFPMIIIAMVQSTTQLFHIDDNTGLESILWNKLI